MIGGFVVVTLAVALTASAFVIYAAKKSEAEAEVHRRFEEAKELEQKALEAAQQKQGK